jgi:hypothetical protein
VDLRVEEPDLEALFLASYRDNAGEGGNRAA